jgi:putative heme-binding domain-containing protein
VLESGAVSVNDLSAAARQQLLHSGSRSMMVRAQRLLESPGASVAKRDLVKTYLAAFGADPETASGSPIDGAALYTQHCGVCHTPDDQGRTIGPSLANLSDRRERSLVEAILDPNLAVEPKYQSYLIRTEDGEILVGAIESELGEAITLARADGTRVSVDRRRVEEMKNSGVSLMPEGIETLLNPAQVEAIIRHVQQLGR